MSKWTVEGANRETGKDMVISVEAATEADALRKASMAGILVSKIRAHQSKAVEAAEALSAVAVEEPDEAYEEPPPGDTIDYARPAAYAPPSHRPPAYEDIVKGERLIKSCASLLSLLGWIGIAIGIAASFVVLYGSYGRTKEITMEMLIAAGTPLIVSILYAIPCFIGAIMLLMYAALAIAVRDMARNSFR